MLASILTSFLAYGHASDAKKLPINLATSNEYGSTSDCIQELVAKIYIHPKKIIHEAGSYYMMLNETDGIALSNLQSDANGYFVELTPNNLTNESDQVLFQNVFNISITRPCPLCKKPGYIAGVCTNPECPSKANKRKYEEDKKQKKEDHKAKKKEKL